MQQWQTYRDQYGTFDTNRRLERSFAMILHQALTLKGGNPSIEAFMVYSQVEEQEIGLEQAMKLWD